MRLPFLHALRKKFGYLVARRAARAARECVLSLNIRNRSCKKKSPFSAAETARDASPRGAIEPGSERSEKPV